MTEGEYLDLIDDTDYRNEHNNIKHFFDNKDYKGKVTLDDLKNLKVEKFDKKEIVKLYNEVYNQEVGEYGKYVYLMDNSLKSEEEFLDGYKWQIGHVLNRGHIVYSNIELIYSDNTYLSDKVSSGNASEDDIIFDDFTYCFSDKGYVLFFGKSGCGKTTLLNLLCGMGEYEDGYVEHNSQKYYKKVNCDFDEMEIAYITQETLLINYLNVYDNLLICSENTSYIDKLLDEFDIREKKESFFNELSGGEKQRIAIIQAVLLDKKIILMDEPTASLDRANKEKVFNIINKLKTDRLTDYL